MKIACITTVRIPAKTANSVQVMKACAALGQDSHDVCLWLPDIEVQMSNVNLESFYGLPVSFPVNYLSSWPRLKRYDFCWRAMIAARRWGTDVIYTWALQAGVFALLHGLPVVLELHGPPEGILGPWLFRLFLGLPGRKLILPISQALMNILAISYHVTRVPHHISPNGVELERFVNLPMPRSARQRLGFPDRLTVGYTGHFYAGRGMNLMLELAHRLPNVQFLWVGGNSEDVAYWQTTLANQGISNVILTGYVENSHLPQYQAAADVLIMPYENTITGSGGGNSAAYCSPMKMFEYMACGRAIVSSDLPVIGEILNKENAVLCHPEDTDAWSQALVSLLADPGKREALSHQALADVQQYTWLARAQQALEGFV